MQSPEPESLLEEAVTVSESEGVKESWFYDFGQRAEIYRLRLDALQEYIRKSFNQQPAQ